MAKQRQYSKDMNQIAKMVVDKATNHLKDPTGKSTSVTIHKAKKESSK